MIGYTGKDAPFISRVMQNNTLFRKKSFSILTKSAGILFSMQVPKRWFDPGAIATVRTVPFR